MGVDLYYAGRYNDEHDAVAYRRLKSAICIILELEWKASVTAPGDHRGVSDNDVIDAIKELKERTGLQDPKRYGLTRK
jgi:hypothetical protein